MDLELMKDFVAVLEHGSILSAAEARGKNQPTLSRRMRELEDALGVLLLNRTSRGVSATVYGDIFRRHAEQLLQDHQHVLDEIRALKEGSHGHARVGMAPAFSGYLPGAVQNLVGRRPGLTFDVVEGTYDSLVTKTLLGEIDGAFTMLPPGESMESLALTRLVDEPIIVVVDANHLLVSASGLSIKELGEQSWIVMNRPRSILDGFHQLTNAHGIQEPSIAIETSSLDFLKSSLKCSQHLALLPRGAIQQELAQGVFRELDIEGLPIAETGFVHRHGVLPPLVLELLQEVERCQRA